MADLHWALYMRHEARHIMRGMALRLMRHALAANIETNDLSSLGEIR